MDFSPLSDISLNSFTDKCWSLSLDNAASRWPSSSSSVSLWDSYFCPQPELVSSDAPLQECHSAVPIVQCNAPLIAPKPLPYHSPTFLQFELLPDIDEDLSHPPYTQRISPSAKRKRDLSDDGFHRPPKRPVYSQHQMPRNRGTTSRYQSHHSPRHPYYHYYTRYSGSGKTWCPKLAITCDSQLG